MNLSQEDMKIVSANYNKVLSCNINSNNYDEVTRHLLEIAKDAIDAAFNLTPEDYMDEPYTNGIFKLEDVKHAKSFNQIGLLALTAQNYSQAIKDFTKALNSHPTPSYFCNRAEALHNIGEFSKSMRDCKRALVLKPKCGRAFNRMGLLNISLKDYTTALKCFEDAVKNDPHNIVYRVNLDFTEENYLHKFDGDIEDDLTEDYLQDDSTGDQSNVNFYENSIYYEDDADYNPLGPC